MKIGVPKEVKNRENRVALTPASVRELAERGLEVFVESHAGDGSGSADSDYIKAGASIVSSAAEVFSQAELILKVKEPQPEEWKFIKQNHTLFTYLHLAAGPQLTEALMESGALCIAYESITADDGTLPLLAPMSEVAGRMAVQVSAIGLQIAYGGMGKLLGGVPGVEPAKVVIIGGGTVGFNAAQMATGLGADVTILDRSIPVMRRIENIFGAKVKTKYSTKQAFEESLADADVIISGVHVPGASTPKLISRAMIKSLKPGSVFVDVAIDQGGCAETSKPTTHDDPYYIVDGVVHYCVSNMPGAVAQTSTHALNNATLPFIASLATSKSLLTLLKNDKHLQNGVNVARGKICSAQVGMSLNKPYEDVAKVLQF